MASAHIWEFHSVLRGPLEIVFLTKLSVLFPGCFRRIADKPSLNPWVIFFVALAIELKMCKETENFQKQEGIWKHNPEVQALKNLFVLRSEMSNFRVATRMPSSCRKNRTANWMFCRSEMTTLILLVLQQGNAVPDFCPKKICEDWKQFYPVVALSQPSKSESAPFVSSPPPGMP